MTDATVIGAGPNGLSAGIALARAGVRVRVLERNGAVGGGCRSAGLTLPGFVHDHCSTVQALACASPFLRELPLAECGVRMVQPGVPLAHPLDDGSAVVCSRSVEDTAAALGEDGDAYRRLLGKTVADWDRLMPMILAPAGWPGHPMVLGRFGVHAIRSAAALAKGAFAGERRERCLPGRRRIRCCRWNGRGRRRLEWCCWDRRMPSAGRWWKVDRSGWRMRWPITSVRWAGRFKWAWTYAASRIFRRPRRYCVMCRRGNSWAWPAIGSRGDMRGRSSDSGMGRGYSNWTGHCASQFPGEPRNAGGRGRCTSAEHWKKSRHPSGLAGRVNIPIGRLCCWYSRRALTRPAPAGEAHRLGVLPCAGRFDSGHDRPDRTADRATSPPALPT